MADADNARVEQLLTVRRWRRYGADRLFVTEESGARVGSIDLQSGEVSVEDPELEHRLRAAAQEYLRKDVTELILTVPKQPFEQQEGAPLEAWLGKAASAPQRRAAPLRTRLERLYSEGWHVIHDVPLSRQGNVVEHLLLGPGGLLTVAERPHVGQSVEVRGRAMYVDGQPVGHLHAARMEAQRVQGMLMAAGCADVHVRSMLVVQGRLTLDAPADAADTLVVARGEVAHALRALPEALAVDRVGALAHVARQRATWAR